MNILRQELRMYRKSLLTWAISLPVITLFFLLIFPSMAKDMDLFMELLKSFPAELVKALGVSNISMGGILGFYSFIMIYVLLAGSIQAMNLGVSVLSAEVRDKTADFLYAKPVSRQKVICMKIAAVFIQIAVTNIVFGLTSWLFLLWINSSISKNPVDFRLFVLLTGPLLLLQILFASLGLLVSALLRRIRTVLPISMGVVFFFYILYVLNQTLDNATLAYLSPFSYFELADILADGAYEINYLVTMILLTSVFIFFANRSYLRKDLPSI